MTKKGVKVAISGAQRRTIDVDAMTQIVIALGRELALLKRDTKRQSKETAKTGAES